MMYILLAAEVVLVACILAGAIAGNAAVSLLALNTILLIVSARKLRKKPSCCR